MGGTERVDGVFTDITLRKAEELLRKAGIEKDLLFSIIARDLKSSMCGLLDATEFLAARPDSEVEKELPGIFSELHKSVQNTYALLEDLLQWARMSQGGLDFAPAPCSLSHLIDKGRSSVRNAAQNKNIVVHVEVTRDISVLVDWPMINTVLRNVLFNAVKFTPRGGEIVISARPDEHCATVTVRDTGMGMEAQTLDVLFASRKTKHRLGTECEKGTGLGLVLCKQFIERHGCRIWAESEPGKGTTVFFTLPAV